MKAVSILVKCGIVQMLCAVSFLLFKIFASNTAGTFGVIAIVLYAITGTTLLCLSCHPKNLFLVLSANIFTLLALLGASGLSVIAGVTIHYDPTHNNQKVNQQAIVLLVNSLVMLSATLASTSKICWLWFCTSDAGSDSSLTNLHVRVRDNGGPNGASRSTLQVVNERKTPSRQPSSVEDNLFQHLITGGSEEEETEDAPPSYLIATGKIPCTHCRFTTRNKKDFVEHFRRTPDHWSCVACKTQFAEFKDFYRHVVSPNCQNSEN